MFWKRKPKPTFEPIKMKTFVCKACGRKEEIRLYKEEIRVWQNAPFELCNECRAYRRMLREEATRDRRIRYFRENPPC